jgi:hypothetical protein
MNFSKKWLDFEVFRSPIPRFFRKSSGRGFLTAGSFLSQKRFGS